MQLNKEDQKISDDAVKYMKSHKKEIIEKYVSCCPQTDNPVSIFMAGSPGAGKTEVSKRLVDEFDKRPLRIDADELRALCPNYIGTNAHLFQKAANRGVHILFDAAIKKQKCNLVLDSTFAYADAMRNIHRSLNRNRRVEIWFIYQEPILAWEFTKAREKVETRKISKDVFVNTYLNAHKNIILAKKEFGDLMQLHLLVKNTNNTDGILYSNIDTKKLDSFISKAYTKEDLDKIIYDSDV